MTRKTLMLIVLALLAALSLGALAESDPVSEPLELAVPEEGPIALEGDDADPGYADFVGDVAVSAAEEGVPLDEAHFPDAVFRKYLADNYDENKNGALDESEMMYGVTIDLSNTKAASLAGLEYLNDVTAINISGTRVKALDLDSCCDTLNWLTCTDAPITTLDLTKCGELLWLECGRSKVTDIDVSGCKKLSSVRADNTPLANLNIAGCAGLNSLFCNDTALTTLDAHGLKELEILQCTGCPHLKSVDVSACTLLNSIDCGNCAQLSTVKLNGCKGLTEFAAFDSAISNISFGDCAALKELSLTKTKLTSLDLSKNKKLDAVYVTFNSELASLKLGTLPKLTSLDCYDNALTALDASGCAALDFLDCRENYVLASLNVSGCAKLDWLLADNNSLTAIDISKNTRLTRLDCNSNKLEALDITKNTALDYLHAGHNKIASINLSKCPKLVKHLKVEPNVSDGICYYDHDEYGWSYVSVDESTRLITKVLTGAKVTVDNQVYTGDPVKPGVTVVLGSKTLKEGTHYKVKYSNNTKIGTATVKVTGLGKYGKSVKATFKIIPKKVSRLELKAGEKKITVSWKKVSGVTGYQLQYATKKDFSNAKKVTVKKAATVKKTVKSLKAKKKYYVRVRAYKTVNGKNYYSKWSAAKSVKTK